ncbi:MAG: hypothetical protein ABIW19_09615 [Vicinamibacterales bacterium]
MALLCFVTPTLVSAQITPAGGTAAGDDTQPPSARVGAVVFYDYTFQNIPKATDAAGNAISPNAFNVARAYVNVTGNISHLVSYRITPDINATRFALAGNNLDGSYVFRLKYAYAQVALTDWTGAWGGSYVRVGVQQTPFIDGLESAYRYRFQGTVFEERDGGMSSSDAGATFHANFPKSYGDFHVGVYNGENYNKAEVNDQKAIMARVTVRPMPSGGAIARGLRVTAFRDNDHVVRGADRIRTVGGLVLEQRRFNLGADYMTRSDQTLPTVAKVKSDGYTMWLTPFFKEKGNGVEMLLRYDSFRPNSANKSARQNRTIAGLAYWFPHPGGAGTAALMLDYEQVAFKNLSAAKQQRVTLHGLINF